MLFIRLFMLDFRYFKKKKTLWNVFDVQMNISANVHFESNNLIFSMLPNDIYLWVNILFINIFKIQSA